MNTSVIIATKNNTIDIDCKSDKIVVSLLSEHDRIVGT